MKYTTPSRRPLTTALLIGSLLALGCGGGGGSSRRGSSTAAGATSSTTTAPTSSATTTPPPPPPPAGNPSGEFHRSFAGRDYSLFVPDAYSPSRPLPLVVAFHGSGDRSRNFFEALRVGGWLQAAQTAEVIVVVPATKSPFQSFPVWSGNPNNDIPAMEAELAEVRDLLVQDVYPDYAVDAGQVHALGFSDGGLFTGAVGLSSSWLATGTVYGYGWGAFHIQPPGAFLMPAHLACGSADRFFPAAQQTQAFLAAQGHDVLWEPVNGVGHSLLGLSAALPPDQALAWMLARPRAGLTTTPPGGTPGAPPGQGSGGTGGGLGLQTRTVSTTAQAGLPSIQVSYEVYVPSGYSAASPIPVLVAANVGLGPWRNLAEAEGFIAVDLRDHDRNGAWNFDYDVLLFDAVLGDVQGAWNVDVRRIYYHGFSAGAHWGLTVVLANANQFAGLGVSAGSIGVSVNAGVFPGQVQRPIPVAIRQGTQDTVVPPAAGRQTRDALVGAGHPVDYSEFAGGHTVSAQDAQAIWAYLRQFTRP